MKDTSTASGPGQRTAGDIPPAGTDRRTDSYVYSTDILFRGRGEITIRHEDTFYRLKITRQGKLILNK
ncbi:hemin uptake protein hemP [Hoeflea marina]|uniref:Hemin uptake protein hemP n=1 Tax=Hoeflea marina TaxID=274592 RepID=A0A317PSB6_9HYPH|nr:hemin uptake protein HemP [Hoeflea marina]PWW03847.1 hemin uptake protein hemP [Hoeflea marina]